MNANLQFKVGIRWLLLMLAIPVCFSRLQGQTVEREVKGVVTDQLGEPMPGVSVLLKGTTIGTRTDANGGYLLRVPQTGILIFSYVGYVGKEVTLDGLQETYNTALLTDETALDEVVVVGYTQQQRANVTGAVSTVKSTELMKTPASTVSGALVGRVQGISTRAANSRPGVGVGLQIRNMGDPLYVIDNVPSDAGTFNQLAPEDIDNISVLKDAAASVYGLRAANGVILITTKKGKDNSTISASGYYGLQNFTRFPRPANAYQHMRAVVEADQNVGNTPSVPAEELERWRLGTEREYQSFDYYDMVMRPNVPQTYINANASGGNEQVDYYISASNLYQEALVRDFSFNRTNIQTNVTAKLAKRLKVGTELFGRIEDTRNVGLPGVSLDDDYFSSMLSMFSMWPTERPYANDNPNYINGDVHNVNMNPASFKRDITGYTDDVWRAIRANFNAEYDIGFGLKARGIYSYGYIVNNNDGFEYTYDAYTYDAATDNYIVRGGNPNPYRRKDRTHRKERYGQFMLSYNKTLGDHGLEAIAAYEQSDWENTFLMVQSNPPNNYIPIIYFPDQTALNDTWSTEARAGYIGRINYNYKGKYLLELLGRYDGSFLYAQDRRWGFFPGVTMGWRISDESFMASTKDWLTDMKLRASYGESGSEMGVAAFQYLGGANYGNGNAVFDGQLVTGSALRGIPVTNLSWVTNETINIGVDLNFFNRLSLTVDAFQRKRTGLPAPRYDVVLPSEVGYSLPNENLNSDANRGVEGAIRFAGTINQDLSYTIGANATYSRLRLLESYRPRFENSWHEYRSAIEDRWIGATWGQQVIGRFQSQEEIDTHPVNIDGQGNRTLLPGDFIYNDVNGDGIINGLDERPIGYTQGTTPYFNYAFNGTVNWKSFGLSFDLVGAGMQTFLRDWELRYPFQNNGTSPNYLFEDRWHRADPYDPNSEWVAGEFPAIRRGSNHSNYWTNDFWVTNVRYLRLRNLEVSYSLPQAVLAPLGLSRLRVYANGTNLLTFDNLKKYGIDPEISSTNGLVYPQQRLYNFGFNLTF